MELTRLALEGLVYYDAASAIRPLDTAPLEKEDIPGYIVCPAYERALARMERSMHRYTARVAQAEDRLGQSKESIAELEYTIEEWSRKAKGVSVFNKITLDHSSASSVDRYNRDVARHNEALDRLRHFQDRLEDAIDKHNDLVEHYNDAVRESEDKLEELSIEALREIDGDLVSFFERCFAVIEGLNEHRSPEDVAAAVEASYLALRLHNTFEVHIDNASSRKEVRGQVDGIGSVMFELCSSKELRAFVDELFQSNIRLIEDNQARHLQVTALLDNAEPRELDAGKEIFRRLFEAQFETSFSYVGIVDPAELETVINRMQETVTALKNNTAESRTQFEETGPLAEAALSAHQESESLLVTMRTAVEGSRDSILRPGHFALDLVDPAVIDGFFKDELRKAASSVREHLCGTLGAEQLQTLIEETEDRFLLEVTERSIANANLPDLQADREKVQGHVRRLSAILPGIANQINEAEKVPEQNAESLRSLASFLYPLSCFPLLGFLAAWFLLYKVEGFAPAFSSANLVYRNLKAELLERNPKFKKTNTYVFINIISAFILAQVDKRLRSYEGRGAPELETESTLIAD